MRKLCDLACLVVVALAAGPQALAQAPPSSPGTASGSFDRLFLAFAEDSAIVSRQWWEGQLEYDNGDDVDALILRGVVAFQPWSDVEIGGRVGFGRTDTSAPSPDGTGATDLDVWGKYYLGGSAGQTSGAVGALATVPTGDDTAGLGQDAFSAGFFGSLRYRLPRVVLSGNAGFRFNADGQSLGRPEQNGKTSARLGAGAVYPLSDDLNVVGELFYEGERFEGGDSDLRLLGGVNWRLGNRSLLRGAVALGLSDGAPNMQLIAGYAVQFP